MENVAAVSLFAVSGWAKFESGLVADSGRDSHSHRSSFVAARFVASARRPLGGVVG